MNPTMKVKESNRKRKNTNPKKHVEPQCRICRTNYGSISFKEELICESCVDYIKNSL